MATIGKPFGSGTIRWQSADPFAKPHIESRLFEDKRDLETAVDTVERMFEITDCKTMRAIASPIFPLARTLRNRARIREKVLRLCDSGYHPCGTVPMGDDDASCDRQGRVYGTTNLRVVDASLFPTIPHANIHLSVLMLAEIIAKTF
jgi:choline dehydrogenase